jgi:hypothetical protein
MLKQRITALDGNYELARNKYLNGVLLTFVAGILVTHFLRIALKRLGWLSFSYNKLAYTFFIATIIGGFTFFFIIDKAEKALEVSYSDYVSQLLLKKAKQAEIKLGLTEIKYFEDKYIPANAKDSAAVQQMKQVQNGSAWKRDKKGTWVLQSTSQLIAIYISILFVGLWLLVYLVWHFVVRNRRDQLTRLRLENTVKELELKTLKAHINPHFIFNSLNSIRALVDEDPQRARTAITELSNLLRSSMQADKTQTTTLEKELKIVEDYLALEKIRFEDRLQVEFQIEDDTLDQQVPPMMLQTLVENAIKHGISKRVAGGKVLVASNFINSHFELRVENSGELQHISNTNGFGIKSTQDRLNLLYGNEASFSMQQKDAQTVEVAIKMPVRIN